MSDRVSIEVNDWVANVRLDRAEKMNALDLPMFDGLIDAGRELAARDDVRAVVLSGNGRAFCAGLDFGSFMAMASDGDPSAALLSRDADGPANRAQLAAYAWTALPMPVIAAIHGVAYGGGLQIALGADIRIVTPDVKMSVMEIKWGLVPDMTGTQTLRRLVRLDVAKELTFTGRVVEGEEAVTLGLATRVADDPRAAALELASTIASKSPDAIRGAKRLLNDAGYVSLEEGLLREEREQVKLLGSKNQLEAVAANLQKRQPQFS